VPSEVAAEQLLLGSNLSGQLTPTSGGRPLSIGDGHLSARLMSGTWSSGPSGAPSAGAGPSFHHGQSGSETGAPSRRRASAPP
jgi:hypothetical protein